MGLELLLPPEEEDEILKECDDRRHHRHDCLPSLFFSLPLPFGLLWVSDASQASRFATVRLKDGERERIEGQLDRARRSMDS